MLGFGGVGIKTSGDGLDSASGGSEEERRRAGVRRFHGL